jgi:hypothetical protein
VTWRSFERTGRVSAVRLVRPRVWRTSGGDAMRARAGDWVLSDGGSTWTVRDGAFRRDYRPFGRDFERHGTVRARPAVPGERVRSDEGTSRARAGQMVVEGRGGELWCVDADHFRRTSRPA